MTTSTKRPDGGELKPCPFCGLENIWHERCIVDATVWCDDCGAKVRMQNYENSDGLTAAVALWNTRTPTNESPAPQADFEAAWAKRPWATVEEADKDRARRWWYAGRLAAAAPEPGEASPSVTDAYERCRSIAEENKLYWAGKCDPLNPTDPSKAVYRAKSVACFQVEMDIAAATPTF